MCSRKDCSPPHKRKRPPPQTFDPETERQQKRLHLQMVRTPPHTWGRGEALCACENSRNSNQYGVSVHSNQTLYIFQGFVEKKTQLSYFLDYSTKGLTTKRAGGYIWTPPLLKSCSDELFGEFFSKISEKSKLFA